MSDALSSRLLLAKNNLLEGKYEKSYAAYETLLLEGNRHTQVYLGLACSKLIAMLLDPIAHQHTYPGVVSGIFNYYREAINLAPTSKATKSVHVLEEVFGQLTAFMNAGDEQASNSYVHAAEHLKNAQTQQLWANVNHWVAAEQKSKFSEYLAKRNMEQANEHQRAHTLNAVQAELLTRIRANVKTEAQTLLGSIQLALSNEQRNIFAESLFSPRERQERAAQEAEERAKAEFEAECRKLSAALNLNQVYLTQRKRALDLQMAKRHWSAHRAGRLAQMEFHRTRMALFGNGPQRHFDSKLDKATSEAKKDYSEKLIWITFLAGAVMLFVWLFN